MSICNQKSLCTGIILVSFLLGANTKVAAYSYYHDNPQSYASGDCYPSLSGIGDRWSDVKGVLNGMGWTGVHYINQDAWASDFVESTLGGHDDIEADAHNVAIFDGHGNVNDLGYSYTDPYGYCDAGYWGDTSSSNIRLGMLGGAVAALAILDT